MNQSIPSESPGKLYGQVSDPMTVAIVCMAFGELFGLADTYITRMLDMLLRHCPVPFRLICYSDRPRNVPDEVELRDCSGWCEFDREGLPPHMRKLGLFNPAYMGLDEFLYLDLTLVIRQSMQQLLARMHASREDLVIIKDWHYECYNSSVMRIRPQPMRFIYDLFMSGATYPFRVPGDQDFIHSAVIDRSQQHLVSLLPQGMVVSFKGMLRLGRRSPRLAREAIEQATIVKFHGQPRMHQAFNPVDHFFLIRVKDWKRGHLRSPVRIAELRSHWEGRMR